MRVLFVTITVLCAAPIVRAYGDPSTAPLAPVQPTPSSAEQHIQMFLDHPAIMSVIGGK